MAGQELLFGQDFWELRWQGKGAEPTELQCEEGKANVVFGPAGSRTQEISVPVPSVGQSRAAGKVPLGRGAGERQGAAGEL